MFQFSLTISQILMRLLSGQGGTRYCKRLSQGDVSPWRPHSVPEIGPCPEKSFDFSFMTKLQFNVNAFLVAERCSQSWGASLVSNKTQSDMLFGIKYQARGHALGTPEVEMRHETDTGQVNTKI